MKTPALDLFSSILKLLSFDFRLAAFVESIFNLTYLLFLFPLLTNLFVGASEFLCVYLASNNSPETLLPC